MTAIISKPSIAATVKMMGVGEQMALPLRKSNYARHLASMLGSQHLGVYEVHKQGEQVVITRTA